LNNHDRPRIVSRLGEDGHGLERARAAALLLLGVRGTPFLYYGEEIGMPNVDVPPEEAQDPGRFFWEDRDQERTPMHWDSTQTRGFSTSKPWLPYGSAAVNVEAQRGRPDSILALYHRALAVRRSEPALHQGALQLLDADDALLRFVREYPGERAVMVVVNTSDEAQSVELPAGFRGEVLVTSAGPQGPFILPGSAVRLPPFGAAWVALA
jgi:glycosidase